MGVKQLLLLFVLSSFVISGELNKEIRFNSPQITVLFGISKFNGNFFPYQRGESLLPLTRYRALLPFGVEESSVLVSIASTAPEKNLGVYNIDTISGEYDDDGVTIDYEVTPKSGLIYEKRIGVYRQFKFVEIMFSPYRINKSTGDVYFISKANIKITFSTKDTRTKPAIASKYLTRIKKMVNSSSEIASYGQNIMRAGGKHLAVITTQKTANSLSKLNNFVASKERRGFKVTVYTEDVWGGGSGDQSADNLHNWLKENYLSEKIDYILIIGDPSPATGDIAMKLTYSYYGGKIAPTDLYFSDVTSNWDINGNGKFGEISDVKPGGIDAIPDISVGRIPLYNGGYQSVDYILQKSINYEQEQDIAWRKNMMLVMYGYYGNEGAEVGENIKGDLSNTPWNFYRIYNKLLGGADEFSITEQGVTDAWVAGEYGIVSWLTHGKEDAALDVMNNKYAAQLSDNYPSFVMMCSCLNGEPSTTYNLAYTLLKNGAIGTISGSSTTIFRQPMAEEATSSYNHGFVRGVTVNLASTLPIGDALAKTKEEADMACWKNYCAFNLYGDPTLGVDVKYDPTYLLNNVTVKSNNDISISHIGDKLTLSGIDNLKSVDITILSLNGRVLSTWRGVKSKSGTLSITTKNVAIGAYLLHVKGYGVDITKQIVVGL